MIYDMTGKPNPLGCPASWKGSEEMDHVIPQQTHHITMDQWEDDEGVQGHVIAGPIQGRAGNGPCVSHDFKSY